MAIISRPEAIPPSLKAINQLFLVNIVHCIKLSKCINYLNHPNLLFIVKRSKNIDDNEIIKPNIINGFDFSLTFFTLILLDEDAFLSLFKRFEKGLFTLKNKFN